MYEPGRHAICWSEVLVLFPSRLGCIPSETIYSRLRLVSNLLPLLQGATSPHILSILNDTKETTITTKMTSTWTRSGAYAP